MRKVSMSPSWTESELARRRAASRRLAWVIGALALFIYGAAFWFH